MLKVLVTVFVQKSKIFVYKIAIVLVPFRNILKVTKLGQNLHPNFTDKIVILIPIVKKSPD